MSEDEMKPNLLTVIPGNITIENFVPGRVYKETLMIYNTCNVPIVINLKSSDKSKLSISDSKLRIGVNQSKKLDLLIQDKINYKYIKTPIKQKKLFIHMKGDLIDVKYEINLLYYDKNKNHISQRNNFNQYFIHNNRLNQMDNEIPNQMVMNILNSDFPQEYLTENPNKLYNNQNINNPNFQNYYNNNEYPHYNNNEKIKFNRNQNITKNINENNTMPFISLNSNDNKEVISLKNIINDLAGKVTYLQSLLEQKQTNFKKDEKKMLSISNDSFYIFGTNIENEIKNKYKLDDNIEIQRILSKNKILELENSTLLYRIKSLEKKLSLYSNNNANNLKNNENYYDMINEDENLEEEEKYYLNSGDNNVNLNINKYQSIYKDENQKKYFDDNINDIPSFENNIVPNYLNRKNEEI